VRKLTTLVRTGDNIARASALRHLEDYGEAAAASLQALLLDSSLFDEHSAIVGTIVKIRPTNASFSQMMTQETLYWGKACRSLSPSWWNGIPYEQSLTPKSHYSRTYAALRAIRELKIGQDLPAVRKFVLVWKKCPPTDENEPSKSQLSDEASLLLEELR
jgi:hypothetical protein